MNITKSIATAICLFMAFQTYGQTNTVTAAKVGVGTTSPAYPIHLVGGTSNMPVLRIGFSGKAEDYVGETGAVVFSKHYDLHQAAKIYTYSTWSRTHYHETDLRFATAIEETGAMVDRMVIANNGNVLINKSSQENNAYRLDVNGKVRANELVVNTSGADFVFEKDYRLRPLSEVEAFIRANGHLPDMASAKEMQKDGLTIGEMSTKLLQKIEEMTLHQIALEKALHDALNRIEQLEMAK